MKMNWDYIAGFFDGEGCLYKNPRGKHSYAISIAQKDKKTLENIKEFLDSQNITCWISPFNKKSRVYQLFLKGYISNKIFLQNIRNKTFFKTKKIQNALLDMRKKWTDLSTFEIDQIRILREYGFTQKHIGKLLNRCQPTISCMIKRNYQKRSVIRRG